MLIKSFMISANSPLPLKPAHKVLWKTRFVVSHLPWVGNIQPPYLKSIITGSLESSKDILALVFRLLTLISAKEE